MKRYLAVIMAVGFLCQAAPERTPEQNLAIIEDGPRYKESTRKRFKFILGSFAKRCSDMNAEDRRISRISDVLARTSRMIKEAGVDESILKTAQNLHKMMRDITTGSGKPSVECMPAWAMYAQLRQEGFPPDEATGVSRAEQN